MKAQTNGKIISTSFTVQINKNMTSLYLIIQFWANEQSTTKVTLFRSIIFHLLKYCPTWINKEFGCIDRSLNSQFKLLCLLVQMFLWHCHGNKKLQIAPRLDANARLSFVLVHKGALLCQKSKFLETKMKLFAKLDGFEANACYHHLAYSGMHWNVYDIISVVNSTITCTLLKHILTSSKVGTSRRSRNNQLQQLIISSKSKSSEAPMSN